MRTRLKEPRRSHREGTQARKRRGSGNCGQSDLWGGTGDQNYGGRFFFKF